MTCPGDAPARVFIPRGRAARLGGAEGAALRAAFGGGQRFALLWGAFGAPWAPSRRFISASPKSERLSLGEVSKLSFR